MRKPMKRNESDWADFPGDCGDLLLVFSVICSMTDDPDELSNIEGNFSFLLFSIKSESTYI